MKLLLLMLLISFRLGVGKNRGNQYSYSRKPRPKDEVRQETMVGSGRAVHYEPEEQTVKNKLEPKKWMSDDINTPATDGTIRASSATEKEGQTCHTSVEDMDTDIIQFLTEGGEEERYGDSLDEKPGTKLLDDGLDSYEESIPWIWEESTETSTGTESPDAEALIKRKEEMLPTADNGTESTSSTPFFDLLVVKNGSSEGNNDNEEAFSNWHEEDETTASDLYAYTKQLEHEILELKCRNNCTEFERGFKKDSKKLVDILTFLPPLNGTRIKNSPENLELLVKQVKHMMSKDFFQRVTIHTLLSRKDTENETIPSTQQMSPEKYNPTFSKNNTDQSSTEGSGTNTGVTNNHDYNDFDKTNKEIARIGVVSSRPKRSRDFETDTAETNIATAILTSNTGKITNTKRSRGKRRGSSNYGSAYLSIQKEGNGYKSLKDPRSGKIQDIESGNRNLHDDRGLDNNRIVNVTKSKTGFDVLTDNRDTFHLPEVKKTEQKERSIDVEKTRIIFEVLTKVEKATSRNSFFRSKNIGFSADMEKYTSAISQLILNLNCHKNCSEFDGSFKPDVQNVVDVISSLKEIKGISIENTFENMALILDELKEIMDKDFFEYVMFWSILDRNDTEDVQLPNSVQMQPEKFIPKPKLEKNALIGNDYQLDQTELTSPVHGTDEEKLDYFRENGNLQSFHSDWHKNHEKREPANRVYEKFAYMHRQLLTRYLIERRTSVGVELLPLDSVNLKKVFRSYYPNNYYPSYSSNLDECKVSSQDVEEIEYNEQILKKMIDQGETYEEYSEEVEQGIHNLGHNVLGDSCKKNPNLVSFMSDASGSARDPMFYRWHLHVDNLLSSYYKDRPYSALDLKPADKIKVEGVRLQSRCLQGNVVENYFETTISSGNLGNQRRVWTAKSLMSEKFNISIGIKNSGGRKDKVIIRMFLAPEEKSSNRRYFIEMDRWVTTLSGQKEEEVRRQNTQNSVTGPEDRLEVCTWPYNLLLPKGGDKIASKFKLVVFVHDVTSSEVNEGEDDTKRPFMYCGAPRKKHVIFDGRNWGFPMDRNWDGVDFQQALDNKNNNFGRISTTIHISFSEEKKTECGIIPGLQNEQDSKSTTTTTTTVSPNRGTVPGDRKVDFTDNSQWLWINSVSNKWYNPSSYKELNPRTERWMPTSWFQWSVPQAYLWFHRTLRQYYSPRRMMWWDPTAENWSITPGTDYSGTMANVMPSLPQYEGNSPHPPSSFSNQFSNNTKPANNKMYLVQTIDE